MGLSKSHLEHRLLCKQKFRNNTNNNQHRHNHSQTAQIYLVTLATSQEPQFLSRLTSSLTCQASIRMPEVNLLRPYLNNQICSGSLHRPNQRNKIPSEMLQRSNQQHNNKIH